MIKKLISLFLACVTAISLCLISGCADDIAETTGAPAVSHESTTAQAPVTETSGNATTSPETTPQSTTRKEEAQTTEKPQTTEALQTTAPPDMEYEFIKVGKIKYMFGDSILNNIITDEQAIELPLTVCGKKQSPFIAANLFRGCTDMKSLIIGEGYKEISAYEGNAEYISCDYISLPASFESFYFSGADGVCEYIGRYTLARKGFEVDENNPLYRAVDGVLFSKDMKTLIRFPCDKDCEEYTVPESVERIERYAFYMTGLKKVILPEGITLIENSVFLRDGKSTPLEVVVPSSLVYMGAENGGEHTSFTVAPGNKYYESSDAPTDSRPCTVGYTDIPFDGGETEPEYRYIDDGVQKYLLFGDNILCNIISTNTTITVPRFINGKEIKTLNTFVFSGCPNMKDLIIGEGYESLVGCDITCDSITLPASFREFGKYDPDGGSFNIGKTNITRNGIYVSKDNPLYCDVDGVLFTKDMKTLIKFPCDREGTYTIPESVTEIEQFAFSDTKLTGIIIPGGVSVLRNIISVPAGAEPVKLYSVYPEKYIIMPGYIYTIKYYQN